jgi:hypothetical protein
VLSKPEGNHRAIRFRSTVPKNAMHSALPANHAARAEFLLNQLVW